VILRCIVLSVILLLGTASHLFCGLEVGSLIGLKSVTIDTTSVSCGSLISEEQIKTDLEVKLRVARINMMNHPSNTDVTNGTLHAEVMCRSYPNFAVDVVDVDVNVYLEQAVVLARNVARNVKNAETSVQGIRISGLRYFILETGDEPQEMPIRTNELATKFRVTEADVRNLLAEGVQTGHITLTAWDGRQRKPLNDWSSVDAFFSSELDGGSKWLKVRPRGKQLLDELNEANNRPKGYKEGDRMAEYLNAHSEDFYLSWLIDSRVQTWHHRDGALCFSSEPCSESIRRAVRDSADAFISDFLKMSQIKELAPILGPYWAE